MTREQIEAKLSELQKGKEQALAQVNAIIGAITLCDEFLKSIAESAQKQETDTDEPDLK